MTAGPVLAAAAAVGYTSGVIAAGATLATATVAAGCGGGMVAEAVTGVNPIKEAVGDEAFDVITTVSTAGAIQGASNISSFVGPSVGSSSNNTSKYISRGSTGRTEPANLTEKLAMEQVKSNPLAGTPLKKILMKDPRWPASEGWVKMQQIVPTSQGDINIHYVYNQTLKIFDDFKFNP